MRKSPVKHTVRHHIRQQRPVRSYIRGHGQPRNIVTRRIVPKHTKTFIMQMHTVDKRFSPSVQERRDEEYKAVKDYLSGKSKILSSVTDGEYTVKITDTFRTLYFKNDRMREPVPVGGWMDFPEEHWKLTEAQYKSLPISERARLEAKEQLQSWIRKEYYTNWLETYKPVLYEHLWWDEGLAEFSAVHGIEATNRKLKPLVEKIWRGNFANPEKKLKYKTTKLNLPVLYPFGIAIGGKFHGVFKVVGKKDLFLVVPSEILAMDKWKKEDVPTYLSDFRVTNIPKDYEKYLVKYVRE